MNDIREIVTKAIISKGKKKFKLQENITPGNTPYSVLGCWVINHNFEASRIGRNLVEIRGSFEVNVWYSEDENTRTDVIRQTVNYAENITTKKIVEEYIENTEEVIARISQHPTCTNAKISGDDIIVDIAFEQIAEVIGETKVSITVFSQAEKWDDNFENEINENFLEE